MLNLFVEVVNLSIVSAWLILAVILLRIVIKRIAPRWTICLLWGLVAICLVVPFSFESNFSIIPSRQPIILEDSPDTQAPSDEVLTDSSYDAGEQTQNSIHINSGFANLDNRLNAIIESYKENSAVTENVESEPVAEKSGRSVLEIASYVWFTGFVLMLGYFTVNLISLKIRLKGATKYYDRVYLNDVVPSPFLFGLIKPRIYLPSDISDEAERYVLAHEKAHINRFDHIVKPLGFVLLSLHWFNPLVWIAYFLLGRDIEYACDEKVIKNFNETERKAYASALLECGVTAIGITCPVAFGEISVKSRILKTLSYKKPALWISLTIITATAIMALCFLSSPRDLVKIDEEPSSEATDVIVESESPAEKSVAGIWYTEGHSLMLDESGEGVCHSDGVLIPIKWTTEDKSINFLLPEEHKGAVELPTQTSYAVSHDEKQLTIGDKVYTSTYVKVADNIDSALVGTWYSYSLITGEEKITFNADGSGKMEGSTMYAFTWSVEDGILSTKLKLKGIAYTIKYKSYKTEGDTLTLNQSGIKTKYSKNRTALGGNTALMGTWNLVTDEEEKPALTFNANGTGDYSRDYDSFFWIEKDGVISFYGSDRLLMNSTFDDVEKLGEASYKINGDELVINYEGKEYTFTIEPGSRPLDSVVADVDHPLGGDKNVVGKWTAFIDTEFVNYSVSFTVELKEDGNGTFSYHGVDVPICWYTDTGSGALAIYHKANGIAEDVFVGEYGIGGDVLYINEKGTGIISFAKEGSDAEGDVYILKGRIFAELLNGDLIYYNEIDESGNIATEPVILLSSRDMTDFIVTRNGATVAKYDKITAEKPFGATLFFNENAKIRISFTDKNGNRISFAIGKTVNDNGVATYTFNEMTINE